MTTTAGPVCLQGGAELRAGCEEMDTGMLFDRGRPRRVLVAAFAARPGRERSAAGANAARWYRGLGADQVAVAEDEGAPFGSALADAELLVLPGGSPGRLLAALTPHAEQLRARVADGLAVSGASAGAMVLCRWTVLPDQGRAVVAGLGVAAVDLVLVHYRGGRDWLVAALPVLPPDPLVLGLPERSGVVLAPDGSLSRVGVDRAEVLPAPG